MKKSKEKKQRMSYETYAYLGELISKQMEVLENEFRIACGFVSQEPSGVDKAHKIFMERHKKLRVMKDELHIAAAATYTDHPKKEMREFWGITE